MPKKTHSWLRLNTKTGKYHIVTERKKSTMKDPITLLKAIVADVEAMQTECPLGEFDMNSEAEKDHWFGWFEFGKYDDESYSGFAIQWPNLGILIEEAKQLIDKEKA